MNASIVNLMNLAAVTILANHSFSQVVKPAFKKESDRSAIVTFGEFPHPSLYSSVEFRHHVNTYYNRDNNLTKQEPSFHGRLTLGSKFYGGALDTYFTLGMIKQPQTQQILQRKPELAIDVTPFKHENLQTVWYNTLLFPVKESDGEDSDQESKRDSFENRVGSAEGTTYILGVALVASNKSPVGDGWITPRLGLDGWTKMYSRKQYVSKEESVGRGDEREPRYSLAKTSNEGAEDKIEDTALHYATQLFASIGFSPGFFNPLNFDLGVYFDNRFIPVYMRTETNIEHHYAVDRTSHYKLRAQWDISPAWTIMNDFYHFHVGYFQQKTTGEDRRFRNILRLAYKL